MKCSVNLSHLPVTVTGLVRRAFRGETFLPVAERLQALRRAMQRLEIEPLIRSRPERDRILTLMTARVLAPHTMLATTRWWHTSRLAEEFGVSAANEDDLGRHRKKRCRTTDSNHKLSVAPNLLKQRPMSCGSPTSATCGPMRVFCSSPA
jgi:hypothetical protein